MLKYFILLVSVFIISNSFSQGNYPEGCYMSFEEIISKTPSKNYNISITKRSMSDIKMHGGNDYKLVSLDKKLKKRDLKWDIWAYSDGRGLYLNCGHHRLQKWYTKVISDGRYMIFIAGIPIDQSAYSTEMQTAMLFGAVGGAFAGAELAMQRYLYVLDKEWMKVTMIDVSNMEYLLREDTILLKIFTSDSSKREVETQIDYLKMLNENFKL